MDKWRTVERAGVVDATGLRDCVVQLERWVSVQRPSGAIEEFTGERRFETLGGQSVSESPNGKFRRLDSGELLFRVLLRPTTASQR